MALEKDSWRQRQEMDGHAGSEMLLPFPSSCMKVMDPVWNREVTGLDYSWQLKKPPPREDAGHEAVTGKRLEDSETSLPQMLECLVQAPEDEIRMPLLSSPLLAFSGTCLQNFNSSSPDLRLCS